MRAVDTNVLVRAFVQDDAAQAARAQALLRGYQIFVPVTVMLELEWVLRSRYGFTRAVIASALTMIASLENAVVGERDAVLSAAAHMEEGWDFADALHHALSAGCESFATFDGALVKRGGRQADTEPVVVPV